MADINSMLWASQLVRRTDLSNSQARVATFAAMTRAKAVDAIVDAPLDLEKVPPFLIEKKPENPTTYNRTDTNKEILWWLKKIIFTTKNPMQDNMAWFFHNFLTTHKSAGANYGIGDQLDLLRANSLGNFRTLLTDFLKDHALIRYLNGNVSTGKNPNENLARELLELFSLGVDGGYTEEDVKAAAKGLSGWKSVNNGEPSSTAINGSTLYVMKPDGSFKLDDDGKKIERKVYDPQLATVEYDEGRGYLEAGSFLGQTKVWDVDSIADRVCSQSATHARIVSMLWYHLAGIRIDFLSSEDEDFLVANKLPPLSSESEGSWWASQDLEIKPLCKRILNHPLFTESHYRRGRSAFEFYCATIGAIGRKVDQINAGVARNLGQLPYEPPNVAGWPDEFWLLPESLLKRANFIFGIAKTNSTVLDTPEVEDILIRCGLYDVSDTTRQIITTVPAEDRSEEGIALDRWRKILASPEFNLT